MFHTAVFLYLGVAAVVVGKKQAFRRYDFSRTASSEQYYCIFQRCLVYAVNVFGAESESFFLHVVNPFSDKRRKPHAFIGGSRFL